MNKIVASKLPAVETQTTEKFVEAKEVPKPTTLQPEAAIPPHVKLWADAREVYKASKALGIDFESLIRGVMQEVENETKKVV